MNQDKLSTFGERGQEQARRPGNRIGMDQHEY